MKQWRLYSHPRFNTVASRDVESRDYDLGTTSVRMIRAGNLVQFLFSNKLDAKIFFADASSTFKKAEDDFKSR